MIMSHRMPTPAVAALLIFVAVATPAVEQVQGEGRALVLDGNETQARREALAKALEDASLRAGATVEANSVLDLNGALHEQTLVRASHRMLAYEILQERLEDEVVTTRIAAMLASDEGDDCRNFALGGRIEVDTASNYIGLPGEAHDIRAVSAYQDHFNDELIAAFNAAHWPATVEFTKLVPPGYEKLTRRATPAAPLRGVLKVSASIRPVRSSAGARQGQGFVSELSGDFQDGLSGARAALGSFEQRLPVDAASPAHPSLRDDALRAWRTISTTVGRRHYRPAPPAEVTGMAALAQALAGALCAPVSIPLNRSAGALSVPVGAAHGIAAGSLFRAETAEGVVFLRAERIDKANTQLSLIGANALPEGISAVELIGHAH